MTERGRPRKEVENETQRNIREQWRQASAKLYKKDRLIILARAHTKLVNRTNDTH